MEIIIYPWKRVLHLPAAPPESVPSTALPCVVFLQLPCLEGYAFNCLDFCHALKEHLKCGVPSTSLPSTALTCAMRAAQVLNLGCGRLPKIAAVMLVSDAVLDTMFDPDDPTVECVLYRMLYRMRLYRMCSLDTMLDPDDSMVECVLLWNVVQNVV
jgi:hypothetical protein